MKSMNKQPMLSKTKQWCDKPGVEQKLLRFIPVYKLSQLQTTERGKSKPNPGLRKSQCFRSQGFLSLDVGKTITVYRVPCASGSCYLVTSEVAHSPCKGAPASLDKRGPGNKPRISPGCPHCTGQSGDSSPQDCSQPDPQVNQCWVRFPLTSHTIHPSQHHALSTCRTFLPSGHAAPSIHQVCAIEAPLWWHSGQSLDYPELRVLSQGQWGTRQGPGETHGQALGGMVTGRLFRGQWLLAASV